jgi:hypothetical protein
MVAFLNSTYGGAIADTDWVSGLNSSGGVWLGLPFGDNVTDAASFGTAGGLIRLGAQRSISWFGPDASANHFSVWAMGFQMAR